VISVRIKKSVGNSKPTVTLDIRDVRILTNYFLPFLQKRRARARDASPAGPGTLDFLSKKFHDFNDLILICQTVYNGGHKDKTVRDLVVKLSKGMNDFRLSNYNGKILKEVITKEEMSLLVNALPLSAHLSDGRIRDIPTGNIDHNNESSVYAIIGSNSEEFIVNSLKEAPSALVAGERGARAELVMLLVYHIFFYN
jgi:hypothetical protein